MDLKLHVVKKVYCFLFLFLYFLFFYISIFVTIYSIVMDIVTSQVKQIKKYQHYSNTWKIKKKYYQTNIFIFLSCMNFFFLGVLVFLLSLFICMKVLTNKINIPKKYIRINNNNNNKINNNA